MPEQVGDWSSDSQEFVRVVEKFLVPTVPRNKVLILVDDTDPLRQVFDGLTQELLILFSES